MNDQGIAWTVTDTEPVKQLPWFLFGSADTGHTIISALLAVLAPLALAVCYFWLGMLHWERMMLLDPQGADCPVEEEWSRGTRRARILMFAFIALWPLWLLLGKALAAWEDRRIRRDAKAGATVA